jgi:hypothetical protein
MTMEDNNNKTKSESELTKMLDSIIDEALKGLWRHDHGRQQR